MSKIDFKENIEIYEANNLLFAVAAVLDEKSKNDFYNMMQECRNIGDPQKIVETIIDYL